MPEFVVPIVRRDQIALWRERWDIDPPTERALTADRDGSLGLTMQVTAKNKQDAAVIAEAKNLGYIAIRSAISRL